MKPPLKLPAINTGINRNNNNIQHNAQSNKLNWNTYVLEALSIKHRTQLAKIIR